MATIKEIAVLAGVSRGTVDRVLNKRGSVNIVTAHKVEEIAKALNYTPNKAGIVLAAQKRRIRFGIIVFGPSNPFFSQVEQGIENKMQELSSYNCSIHIRRVTMNTDAQLEAIDDLLLKNVNGIAMSPCNDSRIVERINSLYEQGIPVVTLNTDIEGSKRIAYVGSNYYKSGETAAGLMRLICNGTARIGIVTGSQKLLCHTERIKGFTDYLRTFSSQMPIIKIVENQDDEFESYDKTLELLTNYPDIDALFFAAGGVYGGCRAVTVLDKKIRIISNDAVEKTIECIKNDQIVATICQQPQLQGSKPIEILFTYLTTGQLPEEEYNYVQADIRIKENL